MPQELFSVWEGVYQSFAEAKGDADAFDTDIWLGKQRIRLQEQLDNLDLNASVSPGAVSKDYSLAMVVAMLKGAQDRVKILDFGGGVGLNYLEVISKIPDREQIDYHIVETPKTIASLEGRLRHFQYLHFHPELPDTVGAMDIVHIGSTLQYIENWKQLLETLVKKYQPKYFVFSDLFAGDIPTFVSIQKFYDKRIPHWFLNTLEFIENMEKNNFKIIYKSQHIKKILNQEAVFPNFDLPESHRIERSINLVFVKND